MLPPNLFKLYKPEADAASGPAVGMIVETKEHAGVPAEEAITTQDSYVHVITPDRLGPHHTDNPKVEPELKVVAKPEAMYNLFKNNKWKSETLKKWRMKKLER